jgi:hypothetical protein
MFKKALAWSNLCHSVNTTLRLLYTTAMEQRILDTNAGKQLSKAATDIYSTLALKK